MNYKNLAIKRLSEILESEMNSYGTSKRIVPISLTLIIPKNIGGMIVGKGGESIKDLRVNSGAQIAFSSEECYITLCSLDYLIYFVTDKKYYMYVDLYLTYSNAAFHITRISVYLIVTRDHVN